ncbi:MAG: 4-(cytidine 5'-diphospho)-2-C-methyl-D-erythritol kinase [Alphaproteobacteria bacterium]|nr:4-(cytidine 5'-diphospho)-2-C-methyl-D-erythritol kinase [Alphaproteobacteria bacterium]
MSAQSQRLLEVFAPAKINLYLHVTGRRGDGYHTLDSLISFADIGDKISLEPAGSLSLEITGTFTRGFKGKDISAAPDSTNLVIKAAWALARLAGKSPTFKITLEKNLPLGGGIGGGSSDCAAAIWAMLEHWNLPDDLDGLDALMLSLGADVPVCFACQTTHVRGIGEILDPAPVLPEIPIVLVHPGKACNTQDVFGCFDGRYGKAVALPRNISDAKTLCDFLSRTENELTRAAIKSVPEIQNILNAFDVQKDCLLARMSGSGSTCFGLFDDEDAAKKAAGVLASENPDWWVKSGWLGRPER